MLNSGLNRFLDCPSFTEILMNKVSTANTQDLFITHVTLHITFE